MIRLFWIVTLSVGMMLQIVAATRGLAGDTCQLRLVADLPIVRSPSGVALVPMVTHGRVLRMLFDTGSAETSIEGTIARQLGYQVPNLMQGMRMVGAGGEMILTRIALPLTIGKADLGPGLAMATDPSSLLYHGDFDGIAGGRTLEAFDEEFDPTAGRIRFFSRSHCPGQVVYWANEYSAISYKIPRENEAWIEFPVKLDGKILRGLFDTGNSHTSMRWMTATERFDLTTKSAGVTGVPNSTRTADGQVLTTAQYTFDTMEFGDIRLHRPVVNLLPQYSQNILTDIFGLDDWAPEVIVGMDVLSQLHFYISRRDKTIYFTVPTPAVPAPAKPS